MPLPAGESTRALAADGVTSTTREIPAPACACREVRIASRLPAESASFWKHPLQALRRQRTAPQASEIPSPMNGSTKRGGIACLQHASLHWLRLVEYQRRGLYRIGRNLPVSRPLAQCRVKIENVAQILVATSALTMAQAFTVPWRE